MTKIGEIGGPDDPNLCKSQFWNTANIGKTFFCIRGPNDQNWWNRKDCPKFFHRVIFAFWIQIWNPNLCKSHTFWNTANIEKQIFFRIRGLDDENRWNWKNLKFFHRVIFACWISATQIYVNPIYFINTANIKKWRFFAYADQNWWRKNCPKNRVMNSNL